VLDVHPSGFYAWLQQPHSKRHQADLRLTGQIKQFWLSRERLWLSQDPCGLADSGQQCGVNRVWRLMKRVGIKAQSDTGARGHAKARPVSCRPTSSSDSSIRMLRMSVG
jgi:hypothetical protein